MSRRGGGKRKHVVQLGNSGSKLHRYGYSKQLHSGEIPKLVGDYPDSDSDDAIEEEQTLDGENGGNQDDVSPVPSEHALNTEPQKEMKDQGHADMDDELRNFLSEIEAIPMPPDPGLGQENGDGQSSLTTKNLDTEEKEHEAEEEPVEEKPKLSESRKTNQYSMFVKGGTEFVHSPSQQPSTDQVTDAGDTPVKEDLPEEPVTPWQMVQDEATQYYYYWNYITNEVTWEIPVEYSQYLLLHKEYMDKLAKLTPEQLKALEARKAEMSLTGDPASHGSDSSLAKAPTSEHTPAGTHHPNTDLSKSEAQASRHRHEKKKKKKRHKRKHSDEDSSDDERFSRDQQTTQKVEMGPAPKPASPKRAGGLLSIVAYASDQEDDEDEEEEVAETNTQKESTALPFTEAVDQKESETSLTDTAPQSSSSELKMPDLSAPLTPQLSPQTMPELSPAFVPTLDISSSETPVSPSTSKDKLENSEDLNIPTLTSQEVDPPQEEDNVSTKEEQTPPIIEPDSFKVDIPTNDSEHDISERLEPMETDTVKEETSETMENLLKNIETTQEGTDSFVKIENETVKLQVKKKEMLDMFAEDFSDVKTEVILDKPPPPPPPEPVVDSVEEKTPVCKDSLMEQVDDTEEGEIDKDQILKDENEITVISPKTEEKIINSSNLKDSKSVSQNKPATGLNSLASYGTDGDEEEEGELVEKPVVKHKKKKKEKKKESKAKKHAEKLDGSIATDERPVIPDKSSVLKTDTFLVPTVEPLNKGSPSVKGVSAELVSKGSSSESVVDNKDSPRVTSEAEPTEDTSVDIDPEDLDDIDRALERALEKKLEQKMVELDSYGKNESSKDSSPAHLDKDLEMTDSTDHQTKESTGTVAESEATRNEVKDIAELALSKLEFLDINTDNLSRLQVLFIELQTRMSDWSAGGLSTEYFLEQLGIAEGLLEQYETSAVPHGWACQWDRAMSRYYYRNLATNRIQWEYPEPVASKRTDEPVADKSKEASEEEKKPRSSSSRHRKSREEKERSKYDKRGSSRRHRRKRHRRRDHSSSSDGSEEETASRHSTSSRHHHKSKKKKRRRSEVRSPSVEMIGREGPRNPIEVVEIPEDDDDDDGEDGTSPVLHRSLLSSQDNGPQSEDSQTRLNNDRTAAAGDHPTNTDTDGKAIENAGGEKKGAEEDVDGEAMDEEEEKDGEKEAEEKVVEEVNAAVISKPPQIIIPPEIAALQPPQLYAAPSIMAAPATLTSVPVPATANTTEAKTDHSQDTEGDKQSKKKKKDKKTSSSTLLKKKHMSSMVQKWQRVKKEVEKEDREKEKRQEAIRQKISELK